MSAETGEHQVNAGVGPVGRTLLVAMGGCLVIAGLLLWGHRGEAVFSDMVTAALAWCF